MHIYFLSVIDSLRHLGLITSNKSIASALGLKTDSVRKAVAGDKRYFNKRFIYKFCLCYGVNQTYIETGQGEMFESSSFNLPSPPPRTIICANLPCLRQTQPHRLHP